MRPCTRQVPNREARVILLSVPRADRVPPLILRLMTRCRRLRSAALLSEGTAGSATKTRSSPYPVGGRLLRWRSMRRHGLAWVADGSCRKGWQRASSCRSRASWRCTAAWPGDECWLWPGRKSRGRRRPTWPVAQHRGRGCAGHGCPAAGGPSSAAWHHHSGEPTHTDGLQGSWSTESLMMSVAALVNVAALLWHAVPPSKSTFSTSPYLRLLQTPLRP